MRWLAIACLLGCEQPAAPPAGPTTVAQSGPSPTDAATVATADAAGDARGKVVVTSSDECGLIVDMIYFDAGSAEVKPTSKPILDATAEMFRCWYRTREVLRWEVQGHADITEKDAVRLSDARAAAIKQALVDRGVLAATLEPKGYGASEPIDRRGTPAARAKNRRVAFLVLDRGTKP